MKIVHPRITRDRMRFAVGTRDAVETAIETAKRNKNGTWETGQRQMPRPIATWKRPRQDEDATPPVEDEFNLPAVPL